jgi:hypothetical protein
MQEKHKVTLYLPPDLHRQLKIKSAVETEPMSAIAERAIDFYLTHSEVVDSLEAPHGSVHQVYNCPVCSSSLVRRDGELSALSEQLSVLVDEELAVGKVRGECANPDQQGEQELVPC